jgi:hypothetical protein
MGGKAKNQHRNWSNEQKEGGKALVLRTLGAGGAKKMTEPEGAMTND